MIIGWLGIILGLFVAPLQLIRIIKTKKVDGISLGTYIFLNLAMVCYLIHAININDTVFIVAQGVNLVANIAVLILLLKYKSMETR